MIAYALLCQPLATITPTKTVVTTRECRIVQIRPSEVENKFELEILEAPPIAVNQEDDD
jgi:hypothetical protein|tara:strand:- start:1455 stop:1631 length:177 start_codon:yes stop_codon:yes gene_type:complete